MAWASERASSAAAPTSRRWSSRRGPWGLPGATPPPGDPLLQLRRRVRVVTVVVDSPARTAESFPIVDELTNEVGLVTSEVVPALAGDGHDRAPLRLARPRF